MPNLSNVCKICNVDESKSWWKCCPKHTTDKGVDVVCEDCANRCMSGKEIPKTLICIVCGSFENVKQGSTEKIKETVFGVVCDDCLRQFKEWLKEARSVKISDGEYKWE